MYLILFQQGQQPWSYVYRMPLSPTTNLEDKVRQVEEKLGIPPGQGVAIRYERRGENLFRVVMILFVVAVLAMFLRAGKRKTRGLQ